MQVTQQTVTMNAPYTFDQRLVLRTPRYPWTGYLSEAELKARLDDSAFLEAIYLASPVLYEECIKWKANLVTDRKAIEKISRSLGKYFIRMSSRCTPFGLFSGCAVVNWNDTATRLVVNDQRTGRHTRLDMHYLCTLSQELALLPAIRDHLRYFPNSSIYSIGDELRYVEYQYVNERRIHQISSVTSSEYLDQALSAARNGATIQQLCTLLTGPDVPAEDAIQFVDELICSQILVSEIEPAITGKEFLQQLLTVLEQIENSTGSLTALLSILYEVEHCLQQIDAGDGNSIAQYRHIMQLLDQLGVSYDESRLFQTDIVRDVSGKGLHINLQDQLYTALEALNKMGAYRENAHLQTFIRRFHERYEEREMPLLEVLDGETGIGYAGTECRDITPLIDDIILPGKEQAPRYTWNRLETMLNGKMIDMYDRGLRSIELTDKDLQGFTASWDEMPPSFSVMFRLAKDDPHTLYLESAGGSSAANLLGRFAHTDPEVNRLVCDITAKEQAQDPDIIFAEVIHLPESRTGNILLHPVFRNYEIPYLAKSSLNKEQQIDLQDLYISVKHNRIILRSARLGKQIIPRLSNAHNYTANALPVYRFLCDLQCQDKRPALSFDWGSLRAQHRFLPRVTFRHTILHLACWHFTQQDLQQFSAPEGTVLQEALQAFRQQWHLPRYVVLSEGDNELLIDFDNPAMVRIWLDAVKNRPSFILREFINDQQLVTDGNGGSYVNQLIAVLYKQSPSYAHLQTTRQGASFAAAIQRQFIPGSEWLYYKLYCGPRSADKILNLAIKPLSEALEAAGLTDKWFFIRYNDPDFHLRLRFHLTDVSRIGDVMNKVHSYLHEFKAAGYIWKMQLDVYNREIERYGNATMELAETLFNHDSVAFVDMLDNTWGDERDQLRWLWALRSVEELLECFGFSTQEKHELMLRLSTAFGAEFNMDRALKLQLNDKYRANKQLITQIMDKSAEQPHETLVAILHTRSQHILPVAEKIMDLHRQGALEVPLLNLLGSYIHMMINRIAAADARMQEMVIYSLLESYYRSMIARTKHDLKTVAYV